MFGPLRAIWSLCMAASSLTTVVPILVLCMLLCRCENTHNTTDCEVRALQGERNTNPGFMIARCSRTCLGCGQKDPGIKNHLLSSKDKGYTRARPVQRAG